ncbi:restriction endonuclease subunit S [Paraclostridium bifermentans]|uniref:restriction endonuclease subunit S n=1 Tax=Paraclostridium bifermentans TaxID=1490 RepID=UPI0034DFBE18
MKKVRLGDLVTIDSGFAFKSSLFNESEGMPIIRIRDVNSGQTNTFYSGEYDEKYIVNKGDLLIGMDGNFTIRKWDSGKALLNQRVCRIKSNSNELSNEYLYRIMPNHLKMIEDRTPFVTVKHLSVKSIDNIELYLPSLEIQKKIANTLDKAQRLIDKRKEQIELLDELVKSRFIDMFGNIITNSYKWDTVKLKDICMLKSGGTPSRSKPEYFKGVIPWITTVALGKNLIDGNDAVEYITQDAVDNSATKLIPEGSLLFGMRVGVGKISVNSVPMCTNQDIMAITEIDTSKYNLIFLKKIIESYSEYFNNQKRGATIQGIKSETLKEIKIPIIETQLQTQFVEVVEQVDKLKFEMKKSLEELEDNLNSLMKKAFNGEL